MKKYLLLVAMPLLSACSPSPNSTLKIELQVDGHSVFSDKAVDDKIDALNQRHIALMDVVIKACQFSSFLNESTSVRSDQVKSDALEMSTLTKAKFKTYQMPGKVIQCHSGLKLSPESLNASGGFAGCSMKPSRGGEAQPQYALRLKEFMQVTYGMKTHATLVYDTLEQDAQKNRQTLVKTLTVTDDGYACAELISRQ